jgi:predicted O-methyltransferase YrrM
VQSDLYGDPWVSAAKIDLIMDLIYMTKPEVCVEIGVYRGSSILPIATALKYNQSGKVIAIDAWSNDVATQYLDWKDPNRSGWASVDMNWLYSTSMQRLESRNLKGYCTVLRTSSQDAVQQVDEIDFLHIDGDHSQVGSLEDVNLYLPKVKSGGFILYSNLYIMVDGKAPKMEAFALLLDECEMVCAIDRDNTILFRKP